MATISTAVFKENLFNGKVLFCTGGGSGICKAMTEAVMRHGANAFIIGRKLDRLAKSAAELSNATGRQCGYAAADVRNPVLIKEAVEKCVAQFGRIDFVICGAAGNFLTTIDAMSENAFRTVLEIDTIGTFITIKATLPHVRATRGSYILMSAILYDRGLAYQAHAAAAKAGVDALGRVVAVEEGPRGVRCNSIAPGPIRDTEGFDRLTVGTPEDVDNSAKSRVPLQRYGAVADIANCGVFLFSDAANWITGQLIAVDGGELHTNMGMVPNYPANVLEPATMASVIKGKL
ncbi:hypothetical protein BS47DRAFT_1323329 [Hydnum rufescens UP504]|uniref:2,4-dienoyl-CoA reductase [(3E)-enoyl-CoA-producing] n=1 Tax=Hydnum rufescens UP504 TaxID=1448309 RepID=A0A9P6BBA8_9AGAM|nr:hypothetical protein BS47DRAFT_1323329 [Hydnum rufescens UP504]